MASTELRVETLESELKVLKAEIRQVLVDIKGMISSQGSALITPEERQPRRQDRSAPAATVAAAAPPAAAAAAPAAPAPQQQQAPQAMPMAPQQQAVQAMPTPMPMQAPQMAMPPTAAYMMPGPGQQYPSPQQQTPARPGQQGDHERPYEDRRSYEQQPGRAAGERPWTNGQGPHMTNETNGKRPDRGGQQRTAWRGEEWAQPEQYSNGNGRREQHAEQEDYPAPRAEAGDNLDVNLISNLMRWVSLAKRDVGVARMRWLVEVYSLSSHMSPGLRYLVRRISEEGVETKVADVLGQERVAAIDPNELHPSARLVELMEQLHGIICGAGMPVQVPPFPDERRGYGNGLWAR